MNFRIDVEFQNKNVLQTQFQTKNKQLLKINQFLKIIFFLFWKITVKLSKTFYNSWGQQKQPKCRNLVVEYCLVQKMRRRLECGVWKKNLLGRKVLCVQLLEDENWNVECEGWSVTWSLTRKFLAGKMQNVVK